MQETYRGGAMFSMCGDSFNHEDMKTRRNTKRKPAFLKPASAWTILHIRQGCEPSKSLDFTSKRARVGLEYSTGAGPMEIHGITPL
jgi:hypothetical protein